MRKDRLQTNAQPTQQVRYLKALLLAMLAYLVRPEAASACSMPQPFLASLAQSSPVIAIGTVTEAWETTFTLEVHEYLKGQPTASHLIVNNYRNHLVDTACNMELDAGHHLTVGNQIVAFLRPDDNNVGANWRFNDPFMEEFIIINNSDLDGRFLTAQDMEDDTNSPQERHEQGLPWFYHFNLEYAKTSTAEDVKADIIQLIGKAEIHKPAGGREQPAAITPSANNARGYLPVFLIGGICFTVGLLVFWLYRRKNHPAATEEANKK
jgi:hypothetical protein